VGEVCKNNGVGDAHARRTETHMKLVRYFTLLDCLDVLGTVEGVSGEDENGRNFFSQIEVSRLVRLVRVQGRQASDASALIL
jgi:hypothetical protein